MPTRLTDELADALTNLETVGYDTPYNSAMFSFFRLVYKPTQSGLLVPY